MFKVIVGPMFSGKTQELIRLVKRSEIAGRTVEVIRPALDTRYGAVRSHDGLQVEADEVECATAILKLGGSADLVAVDEVQFFELDIVDVCLKLISNEVDVVVAGLDKDSRGKPFGAVPILLALAHEVRKLSAVCAVCGEDAHYTYRLGDATHQVLVGGKEDYEARCYTCWTIT